MSERNSHSIIATFPCYKLKAVKAHIPCRKHRSVEFGEQLVILHRFKIGSFLIGGCIFLNGVVDVYELFEKRIVLATLKGHLVTMDGADVLAILSHLEGRFCVCSLYGTTEPCRLEQHFFLNEIHRILQSRGSSPRKSFLYFS